MIHPAGGLGLADALQVLQQPHRVGVTLGRRQATVEHFRHQHQQPTILRTEGFLRLAKLIEQRHIAAPPDRCFAHVSDSITLRCACLPKEPMPDGENRKLRLAYNGSSPYVEAA
jgi:hypothetical protein